eukprot:652459_1
MQESNVLEDCQQLYLGIYKARIMVKPTERSFLAASSRKSTEMEKKKTNNGIGDATRLHYQRLDEMQYHFSKHTTTFVPNMQNQKVCDAYKLTVVWRIERTISGGLSC